MNRETGKALGIGRALLLHLQFRYAQRQFLTSHWLVQLCRHRDFTLAGFGISLFQLQLEILDIRGRHPHKEYVARDAAIVPPVEYLCGHGLGLALVVHFHDDRVFSVLQQLGHIKVEGRETTHMMSCLVTVNPYTAIVVDGTEIENRAVVLDGNLGLETGFEPYRALVEKEFLVLCVPVAGHLHGGSLVEIVLDEVFGLLRLGIAEESPARRIHAIVVVAFFLHIYDVVPLAVERHRLTAQHIGYLGHLDGSHDCCQRAEKR